MTNFTARSPSKGTVREPVASMNRESFAAAPSPSNYSLSTKVFAGFNQVKPQTVRKRYSQTGSYFGVRPLPLPNRKLLWPDDSILQLLAKKLQGDPK